MSVDEALSRLPELDEEVSEIQFLGPSALLLAMADRPDEARQSVLAAVEALGRQPGVLWEPILLENVGEAELVLGDLTAAERYHRRAVEWLESRGERSWLSTYGANYACTFFDSVGPVEARRLLELARAGTTPYDVESQACVRGLEAKLLSRTGDHERATELCDEAATWIERADQLVSGARHYLEHAEVYLAAGHRDRALGAVERALTLFTQKGNRPDMRRTRDRLDRLAAGATELRLSRPPGPRAPA